MSDLEHVRQGIEGLLEKLGMPPVLDLEQLVDNWHRLAGEPWASKAKPVSLDRGTLWLEVADGATATLLGYQTTALLARLEEGLATKLVERIRLRVGTPKKASDLGKRDSGDVS